MKSTIKKSPLTFFVQLIAIGIFATSCSSTKAETAEVTAEETTENNTEQIAISKEQFAQGKMEFGNFSSVTFFDKITTTGKIIVTPQNQSSVSSYFGGYVKNINLIKGQKVNKGQTLLVLENPDYIEIQKEYLVTKDQLVYLQSDYQRQKELAKENISSQKTFIKAETDYKVALNNLEFLKKKLALMGINAEKISPQTLITSITVTAPISGYITAIKAKKGAFLTPSDVAVEIVNTDDIKAQLSIFEQDLAQVKTGQKVRLRLQNSTAIIDATVSLIDKIIDSEKRTINVLCSIESNKDLLALGMYLEADILTTSKQVVALPENAVVNVENDYFVLVLDKQEENQYLLKQKLVKVGSKDLGNVEILNANEFNTNDKILIRGAFNLINE